LLPTLRPENRLFQADCLPAVLKCEIGLSLQ
jgi:hypothetical protein